MLLNLSNHPSTNWHADQLDKAIQTYSRIEDIAFPHIKPEENTEGVQTLAKAYAATIINQQSTIGNLTVHLMGEMTFVVALVGLLQAAGIEVVCSTTERIVLAEINGKKTMQFRFVRFRAFF